MSTTFDVYPRTSTIPTFASLLERSNAELHRFLGSVDIASRPTIRVRLQRKEDDSHVPFSLADPARWDQDLYAWFMVGDFSGGTDAYYQEPVDLTDDDFDGPKYQAVAPVLRECLQVGHLWWFRRSAGQPGIINLAYGLIAGSLAALTDGLVDSHDGAWERMPASPQDFLQWYFRPEQAVQENCREWSTRCLALIREDLRG